ncbi:MAG: hypothetical protein JKY42_06140 [Flavobacteriales bacterium]|nr:hypothetical protein [Flavobacteriales bacterium]
MKTSIVLVVLGLIGFFATANSDSTTITRPAQVTVITPMGTNGLQSLQSTNNFSLNIFAGMAGGLNGLEVGGFANVIKYDMKGVQLAGFTNVVLGKTIGTQLAGYFNYSGGYVKGTQLAGYVNIALDSVKGGQISGFVNLATKDMKGIALSGYANICTGEFKGVQTSGFANVVTRDMKGAQFSGFANVTTGNVQGAQVSGFVNYTSKLSGLQLGFINICDSVESGTPIGFLSVVKHGYHEVELGFSESLYGTLAIKAGTNKFYNIFSIGAKPVSGNVLIGFGYGVGTSVSLSPKMSIRLEDIAYGISGLKESDNYVVLLNQLSLLVSYNLNSHVGVNAGPSFNTFISVLDAESNVTLEELTPYSMYNENIDDINVQLYPGLKLAVAYKF